MKSYLVVSLLFRIPTYPRQLTDAFPLQNTQSNCFPFWLHPLRSISGRTEQIPAQKLETYFAYKFVEVSWKMFPTIPSKLRLFIVKIFFQFFALLFIQCFLNKLLTACFSPPRLAVSAFLIFISASTVSILNLQNYNNIFFICQIFNFI